MGDGAHPSSRARMAMRLMAPVFWTGVLFFLKMVEVEPLQTSYDEDLYNSIFRTDLVEPEIKMNERGYNDEQI
jgi:hypothetical protein